MTTGQWLAKTFESKTAGDILQMIYYKQNGRNINHGTWTKISNIMNSSNTFRYPKTPWTSFMSQICFHFNRRQLKRN